MTWTQPICDDCYQRRYPDRMPSVLLNPSPETCCDCGADTLHGIYVRVDPATVAHPTRERDP